jgi:tRNA(adenine34) deaminase
MSDRETYMREALRLAKEAAAHGDVPVGCVIADAGGNIIGRGRNRREECHDATAHAEVEAIREACARRGSWRLDDCAIFVTLEPCPMCTGAIINARIPELIFGAREENTGSCGSVIDLFSENYGHRPRVFTGLLAEESRELLREFFLERRNPDAQTGD